MRFCLVTFALLLVAAPHAQAPPPAGGEGQANYVVGPEDVLAVTVFNEAQLSGRYRVENDGHFSYPFLGWPRWPPRCGPVWPTAICATRR
jgi:protein involved in polysaccharide export with SLBB domain